MLQRSGSAPGPIYYVSPLLARVGVPHAFSTRRGGISPPPFDSLNLGNPNGCDLQDLSERILENYRLLLSVCGCADRELCYVHQVHGDAVVRVAQDGARHDHSQKADALITDDPHRVVSVRVADCVPVLLASGDGRVVAAVHAGWRGTIAGVASAAVARMRAMGATEILAAIGPCISQDAFEVGPEVAAEFSRVFGKTESICRRGKPGKHHVNLREAIRIQLAQLGIPPDRIDTTDRCTFRDRDEFFSHRREHGVTGRMAAIIRAS